MNQRITLEQIQELNEEQKVRLREWWMGSNPRLSDVYVLKFKYDDITRYEGPYLNSGHRDFLADFNTGEALPLLTIGQMIDVIDQGKDDQMWHVMADIESCRVNDLCDRLWETVKLVL